MSREKLEKATCKELQEMCKSKGIPYSTHSKKFTKAQMVEALLGAEEQQSDECSKETTSQSDDHIVVKEKGTIVIERRNREEHLQAIKPGVFVAYAVNDNDVKTATVLNVSFKRKQLKVASRRGDEFVVEFRDVLWVSKKGFWPPHIMNVFKNRGKQNVVIK